MINSLSRDSHMSPALANPQAYAKSSVSSVKLHKNASSIPAMEHDQVSFGGISAARLANDASAKEVFKLAEKFLKENAEKIAKEGTEKVLKDGTKKIVKERAKKVTPKTVGAFVSEIAEKVVKKDALEVSKVSDVVPKLKPESNAAKFLNQIVGDSEKVKVFDDFFSNSAKFVKESQAISHEVAPIKDANDTVTGFKRVLKNFNLKNTQKVGVDGKVVGEACDSDFADAIIKDAKVAMETMPVVNKQGGFHKSKVLKGFLNIANDNSAVFSALTAAAFACALRPATIMAMPAKGKNKEDNKYSAAHSISSGLVGAAVALAINLPIALSLKAFAKNPTKYAESLKKNVDVSNGTYGKYLLDAENHLSDKAYDDGVKLINLGSELLLAIPQALLTTALIPPVLKKLGIQKSSSKAQQVAAQQNTTQTTAAQTKDNKKEVSFKGKQVNFEGAKSLKNPLSILFAKLFSSNKYPDIVKKMNGATKDAPSIVQKMSTLKSALISGLYVTRTMSNKNLDPDRRTTLAINQASVWGVATILNLTIDSLLNKATEKFVDNYRAANFDKLMSDNAGNLEKTTTALNRLNGGIKAAKSLIIVSLVYRYLSPVLVTPLANKIGNFVEAKKKEKAQVA